MALIKCKECGNKISKKARECPNCGAPSKKRTSLFTWLMTALFALGFIGYINAPDVKNEKILSNSVSNSKTYPFDVEGGRKSSNSVSSQKSYPASDASYAYTNAEVGCDSKYSDDKKENIFKENYKNHWMTWSGSVVLPKAGAASLNIDGIGTQDLGLSGFPRAFC